MLHDIDLAVKKMVMKLIGRTFNNLLTRHLVLILPLIARQIFSFSSDGSTENFANTSAFKLFSLFLSYTICVTSI